MPQEGKFGVYETIYLVVIAMLARVFCICPQIDINIYI